MPYRIDFSNTTKEQIIVEDGTIENTRSSLDIPGRNITGYGTIVGQNFIRLLENFASPSPPRTPIEGQLWFDSNSKRLKVSDSTADAGTNNNNWRPASGVHTQDSEPTNPLIGDLWVDTSTKSLYLYTGSTFILVGPEFSDGLSTGATPSKIIGTDNIEYTVLKLEIEGKPNVIVSPYSFTPKNNINGFATIKPGINIATSNISGQGTLKVIGTSENAENLIVGNTTVGASNFLRSDQISTTNYKLKIKTNDGIDIGTSDTTSLSVDGNNTVLTNKAGANIDFKVGSGFDTVLRIAAQNSNVGIKKLAPEHELDVGGDIRADGAILADSTASSTGTTSGSIQTKGGLGVGENANIGQNLKVFGNTTLVGDLIPDGITNSIGQDTNRFDFIYSNVVSANTFIGNLQGSLTGNLNGTATQLRSPTTFRIKGDITSQDIEFDGKIGPSIKEFDTTIDPGFIGNKEFAENEILFDNDEFIINRKLNNEGLLKVSKGALLKSIPQFPVGMIVPYVGVNAPPIAQYGGEWIVCDGRELSRNTYEDLFEVVGTQFGTPSDNTLFKIPDLRGRIPLGFDASGSNVSADASQIGFTGGADTVTIAEDQIPDHKHDLINDDNGSPYYATRKVEEAATGGASAWNSPTGDATSAIPFTGGILNYANNGQRDINVMNPFLAINFIIWTGKEV